MPCTKVVIAILSTDLGVWRNGHLSVQIFLMHDAIPFFCCLWMTFLERMTALPDTQPDFADHFQHIIVCTVA